MSDRSTGLERRHTLSARALFVGFVTISVITVACSDSERRIPIGGGANDDGDAGVKPPPTHFDERDASAVQDDGTPNPSIKMCIATECPYPFTTCSNSGTNNVHACGT
ncbi:MAG: Tryptophan synthase alpha chain, partial [Labilithrix sp.]|nr:Tryptophan synthase alpha chain [Labilithrix sp.]